MQLTPVELQGAIETSVIQKSTTLKNHSPAAVSTQEILGVGGEHQCACFVDERIEMGTGFTLKPLVTC
jgi:hypothetical protein